MQSNIMLWLAGLCLVLFIFVAFKKQVKFMIHFLIRGAVGVLGFSLVNIFAASTGLLVGINLLSVAVVGFLGIPGFLCLYIVKFIVK